MFTVLVHASLSSRLNASGHASLGALSFKFIDRLSQCCVQIGTHEFPRAEVDERGLGALVPSLPLDRSVGPLCQLPFLGFQSVSRVSEIPRTCRPVYVTWPQPSSFEVLW